MHTEAFRPVQAAEAHQTACGREVRHGQGTSQKPESVMHVGLVLSFYPPDTLSQPPKDKKKAAGVLI